MARGSWRSRWAAPDSTRSSTSPWAASARARASSTGTTSSLAPCTSRMGRGGILAIRPSGRISRSSRAQASRSGGKAGIPDHPGGPGLGHEAAGVHGPLGEVGRGREGGHAPDPRVLSGGAQGQGPAGGEPARPYGVHAGRLQQHVGGGFEVGQPAAEREVARRLGDAPEAEGEHHPAGVGGQAVRQLVVAAVGMPGLAGLHRKAVAEHQPVPAGAARGRRGRPGQVGGQRHPAGPDRERPAGLGRRVGGRGAHGPTLAQRGRPKATPLQGFTGSQDARFCVGWDQVPDRHVPGNWCGLTRWSSGRLATSHLRGPTSLTAQLDHLLSSVTQMLVTLGPRIQAFNGAGDRRPVRSRCAGPATPGGRWGRRRAARSSWPA